MKEGRKMKKMGKLAVLSLCVCTSVSLAVGCGANTQQAGATNNTPNPENVEAKKEESAPKNEEAAAGKVYFLNFKSELAQQWEQVVADFTAETGIEMKVVTAGSGTYEQTLKSEVAKRQPPTMFNINGPVGYKAWKEYCGDLKGTKVYEWLLDKSLAITEGEGVYGIPYSVETYGIIYNDAIMKKYFELPDKAVAISDAKDIKNFGTLKVVVEDMTKHKEALGIEGVFGSTSFAPGEDWRWQTHLANLPVYYEYRDKNVGDLGELDFSYAENFKNIFDLYLDNSCTDRKMVGSKNVEESMSEFALGKVAMIQNGNWGWAMIEGMQGNTVAEENIKFLPIYTGVAGEEKQGLCTGTENFICINSKVSKEDQVATEKFLEWLFGSEKGKAYCIDLLGMISPFNTFGETERPNNPLAKEMLAYMDDESLTSVSWNFTTFPSQQFKNDFGASLLEYAQGSKTWETVVEDMKASWKEEKAAIQ